jgi:hypothetical protein
MQTNTLSMVTANEVIPERRGVYGNTLTPKKRPASTTGVQNM